MKPKTFEYMLENNPLRGLVKENIEVKYLRSVTDVKNISHALEIGCGNGNGTRLIRKYFSPDKLSAVDRYDESISEACRKNRYDNIDFSVQKVDSLNFGDECFDAVFDLADLHNIEGWKKGLAELKRVLKHNGLLILEEISIETFNHAAGRLFKKLTEHPYETMLTVKDFKEQILLNGFEILHFEEKNPFGLLKYFIMIAKKV